MVYSTWGVWGGGAGGGGNGNRPFQNRRPFVHDWTAGADAPIWKRLIAVSTFVSPWGLKILGSDFFLGGVGGHVGVVKPLDAEAASEWGAGLLGVREALRRSRRCAWCANGVHDRGGWYPWRSVQVEWLVGDTKGKVYYYKAGDSEFDWFSTGRNQSDFDLVQAGCQKTARLDWAMLQKEARKVDAAMELKASEIGVGHHIVQEIIACEAAFGHALPLRHTHASRKREVARAARKRANAAVARKRAMEAVARKRTESRAVRKRAQVGRGGVAGQSLLTAFFKAK